MRILKVVFVGLIIGISCTLIVRFNTAEDYSLDNSLEDLEFVKRFLIKWYPNLDWAVESLSMNLSQLYVESQRELRMARSETERKKVLTKFVEAFNDGHLWLDMTTREGLSESEIVAVNTPPEEACKVIGFRTGDKSLNGIASAAWSSLSSENEPYKVRLSHSKEGWKLGMISIASFSPRDYESICRQEWLHFGQSLGEYCDTKCRSKFFEWVEVVLLQKFKLALSLLLQQRIDALIIDVRANPGGSGQIARDVRSLFAPPDLKCGSQSEVAPDLVDRCDRSALWSGDLSKRCSILKYFSVGCVTQSQEYKGPLFVLVDRDTASSAELFASPLQYNNRAKIIGERTSGTGCGYRNGGIKEKLPHLQAYIKSPSCVWYKLNGRNEREGILPDIAVQPSDLDRITDHVTSYLRRDGLAGSPK